MSAVQLHISSNYYLRSRSLYNRFPYSHSYPKPPPPPPPILHFTTLIISTMISTSFRQSPLPMAANKFPSGENPLLSSPSCVRFRQQSSSSSIAATSCASVARCVPLSASPASFYEILGIPMGATMEEIKAAYRRLARVCHPDVAAIDHKEDYAEEFMKIHDAYYTLSDPDKRADYDRLLFRRRRSGNLYSGYTCRNWETDQCW
ncbi:chaperone protein dnaJ 11, chloroplastic-like [Lycium barbarum]|uniref:chaperone protein dnaJ 11, chloroplastic-like n=1 Tax=Lycium barbarum TaxID=112863 RepID=UPI00293E0A74|nr:chaperone protein dnaJ 11, chloroplastic-like [Lycium barbarum]